MPLLSVKNLHTHYFTETGTVKAVENASFNLDEGESLGIAGESGCGKSTIALSIMRLIKSGKVVEGKITFNGKSLLDMPIHQFRNIRWKEISIIFQGAMSVLDPVYTVGDQIAEAIHTHMDSSRIDTWEQVLMFLRQVNISPSRAKSYPHELSGGMRQRVMIAMALACNPKIVIADEPTTALDVVTQAQIIKLIKHIQKNFKLSTIYISHELSVLSQTCNRIAIMYAGKIIEIGNVVDIFKDPLHPYTKGLLDSCMDVKSSRKKISGIPGRPPDLIRFFEGCRFHPRCPYKKPICEDEEPELLEHAHRHHIACHFPGDYGGDG